MKGEAAFLDILRLLAEHRVEFVLVGGVAATLHGSAFSTSDVDIVYARTDGNIDRLAEAVGKVAPYLRGAPPGLPFRFDAETIRAGLNFTLTTDIVDLDVLGEIPGGGTYDALLPESFIVRMGDFSCRCVSLAKLIELKKAAGRRKDIERIGELQALLDEQRAGGGL